MASPGADRSRCLREYNDAYRKCSSPAGVVDGVQGESAETKLSKEIYRIPYADGTKVHISRDFCDHNPPGSSSARG